MSKEELAKLYDENMQSAYNIFSDCKVKRWKAMSLIAQQLANKTR